MLYLNFIEFTSHGEEEGDDTEGHFLIACEAASPKEVVDKLLPEKLKAFESKASEEGDYLEFYLRGIVELKHPVGAPVVLGMTEGDITGVDVFPFSDIMLEEDEAHARGVQSVKINSEIPFHTIGEPPQRIVDLARRA